MGNTSQTSRLGGWLPSDRSVLNEWLKKTIEEAEKKAAPFQPVVKEFQKMIESDPVMHMYFTQMFEQQPNIPIPNSPLNGQSPRGWRMSRLLPMVKSKRSRLEM